MKIIYSTTTANTSLLTAQYVQDAWAQIGIDTEIAQIEQSKLINNALFGDAAFDAFGWRNHAGLYVDSQYFWWHGSAATPDGGLALNFGRLNDPVINDLLEQSRSEADPDVRRGYRRGDQPAVRQGVLDPSCVVHEVGRHPRRRRRDRQRPAARRWDDA